MEGLSGRSEGRTTDVLVQSCLSGRDTKRISQKRTLHRWRMGERRGEIGGGETYMKPVMKQYADNGAAACAVSISSVKKALMLLMPSKFVDSMSRARARSLLRGAAGGSGVAFAFSSGLAVAVAGGTTSWLFVAAD